MAADPQRAYAEALAALEQAERDCLRSPSVAAIRLVIARRDEATAAFAAVPREVRATIGNRHPLMLLRNQPVLRRDRHSDWHPMTWRGQDN